VLQLTGERTLPGIWHENYWFRRHEIAYLAALPLARGARVLDAGCGEGYGAALLADEGADVVAADLDLPTLCHVAATYAQVRPVLANLVRLPFGEASFDTVVSLQVVEHLWDQETFVAECARALREFGLLVLSTPNRLTFSPDHAAGEALANPFHSRELAPQELVDLVSPAFRVVELLGVHHGQRITAWEDEHGPLPGQLRSAPGDWPRHVADVVASVEATDFAISTDRLQAALDLLVVAERRP
jgi:SAM-dependent methyltransferase